mmetsp:Transcript_63826/g.139888  ORF Transcript_63826/g.139888 Transcript_63826/m.139888 type:complete len:258 (+) Transcript_63826:1059-1832(+)
MTCSLGAVPRLAKSVNAEVWAVYFLSMCLLSLAKVPSLSKHSSRVRALRKACRTALIGSFWKLEPMATCLILAPKPMDSSRTSSRFRARRRSVKKSSNQSICDCCATCCRLHWKRSFFSSSPIRKARSKVVQRAELFHGLMRKEPKSTRLQPENSLTMHTLDVDVPCCAVTNSKGMRFRPFLALVSSRISAARKSPKRSFRSAFSRRIKMWQVSGVPPFSSSNSNLPLEELNRASASLRRRAITTRSSLPPTASKQY